MQYKSVKDIQSPVLDSLAENPEAPLLLQGEAVHEEALALQEAGESLSTNLDVIQSIELSRGVEPSVDKKLNLGQERAANDEPSLSPELAIGGR